MQIGKHYVDSFIMETISIDKECIISIPKELTGNIKDNFVDGHVEVHIIKNPSLYIKK